MDDFIISVNTLPEPLHRRIRSDKVKVHESNGVFTLIPLSEQSEGINRLFGMFSDGKMSSEKYSAQKQADKELEP